MERRLVGRRVDRDSGHAQFAAGADDANGDLPAVGDEDLLEHWPTPVGAQGPGRKAPCPASGGSIAEAESRGLGSVAPPDNGLSARPLSSPATLPIRRADPTTERSIPPDHDTGSGFTPGYRFPLPAGPVSFDCTHQPASCEGPKPARPFTHTGRPRAVRVTFTTAAPRKRRARVPRRARGVPAFRAAHAACHVRRRARGVSPRPRPASVPALRCRDRNVHPSPRRDATAGT